MGTRFKDHKYVQKGHFLCAPLFDMTIRTRDSPSRQSAKAKSGEKETKERERDLVGLCLARWKLERTRTGKSPSRFIRNIIIIVVVNIHR